MTVPPERLGYVLKRFPRISETFILSEILELERQGVPLEIFSLLEPTEEFNLEALKRVGARVTYFPRHSFLEKYQIREGRYADGCFREHHLNELLEKENRGSATLLFQAAALTDLARVRGVKHLHAHFGTSATTVAMLAGRLSGVPYSFTAHAKGIYHESVDSELLVEKILGSRFVRTVSDFNQQYLAGLAGENSATKIIRLYNGLDLEHFQPDPSSPRETRSIFSVGRLVEKEGFSHLIKACRLLKDWQQPFRCHIVGEGPERASLLRYERYSLWSTAGAGLRAAREFHIPCLVEVNAPLLAEQRKYRELALASEAAIIEAEVFAGADALLTVSEQVKDYVLSKGGSAERTFVVPNGVDNKRFHTLVEPQAVAGLEGKFVIGFVGSLKPWHGVEVILDAFRTLTALAPDFHLLLVADGPLRSWIEGYVQGASLEGKVSITGWVPYEQLPGLIQGMDVTVASYPFRRSEAADCHRQDDHPQGPHPDLGRTHGGP